jgi:hypothetical protein
MREGDVILSGGCLPWRTRQAGCCRSPFAGLLLLLRGEDAVGKQPPMLT